MSVKPNFIANTITKKILLLSFLLLSTLASQSAFAFTNLETGKPDKITNYIGNNKWTVLEIWASDCPACRMHMPEMVEFDGKLKNTRLLSVSVDGLDRIEDTEDFITEFGIEFPTIMSNPIEMNIWMQQSVGESFVGTPTFILFDPEGKLVAAQPGIVSTTSLEKFITDNSKPEAIAEK